MTDPAPRPGNPRPPALTQMVHFITCRLAGIVPLEKLDELRVWREEQLELIPDEPQLSTRFQNRIRQRFFTEYDRLLDDSRKGQLFINKPLAALIRRHLLCESTGEYKVLSYTIMPNHVHVIVQAGDSQHPREDDGLRPLDLSRVPLRCDEKSDYCSPLVDFLLRFKQETAADARCLLEGSEILRWHDESFDYWIRTQGELEGAVDYIAHNPVSAGLVRHPEHWFFSSAHERFLHEGVATGWLPK